MEGRGSLVSPPSLTHVLLIVTQQQCPSFRRWLFLQWIKGKLEEAAARC